MTKTEHMMVAMRDGVKLATEIFLPGDGAGQYPVLLTRTPYGRAMAAPPQLVDPLIAAGYAVVVQDCRGRGESEGEWAYVTCELEDGYDIVEWAASQSWSNKRVGMFGASYMANTQWTAAIERPPHLVAIMPECCPSDFWTGNFQNGAFRLSLRLGWTAGVVSQMAPSWGIQDPRLDEIREAGARRMAAMMRGDMEAARIEGLEGQRLIFDVYRSRPMRDNPLWHGRATWLDELFEFERRDDAIWRRISPETYYDVIDLPAIHIAGWYDIHLPGTINNFVGMRRQAPSPRARDAQHLIIGPWSHWTPHSPVVGEVNFGPEAVLNTTALRLEWFGHWLQDAAQAKLPPVRLFVMGENIWRDEQEWPLARTQYQPLYLTEGGALTRARPAGATQGGDRYSFDPRDPVPAIGGRLLTEDPGPKDQRPLGARTDILVYDSAPLNERIEITGPVTMDLWASTDAPDTDFTAMLIDVHPDGAAMKICEGIVRARHAGIPMPLIPDAIQHFTIDMGATSIVIGADHTLRVHVTSSGFPQWEPNPNSGKQLGTDTDADLRIARQTIYRDAQHPSRINLPVIPR